MYKYKSNIRRRRLLFTNQSDVILKFKYNEIMILNGAINESWQTNLTHGRGVLKCILNHHNFIFNIYKNLAH